MTPDEKWMYFCLSLTVILNSISIILLGKRVRRVEDKNV